MHFALSSASLATSHVVRRVFERSTFSGLALFLLLLGTAGTASAQSTPTNLTATASSGQVSLSWTASSFPEAYPTFENFYAAYYRVYRSTTPGGEAGNQIAEVDDPNAGNDDTPAPSTTYTDTNVTPGVTYYYTVTAVLETTRGGGEPGGGGETEDGPQVDTTESDMSNEASVTLAGTVLPSAPTGLTATAGDGSAALSWTAPSGSGLTYNVKRATVSGGPYNTVGSSSGTSYPDTGLTNGTTYYYVVTAVGAGGESGNSNEAMATPAGPAADFAVAASPNNFGITPGGTASTVVTLTPSSTFSGSVALSVSGLPSGVTASFSPASPVTVTAGTPVTSTLTLTATNLAPTATLTVTATSGTLSHKAAVTLTSVSSATVGLVDLYLDPVTGALTNKVAWGSSPSTGANGGQFQYYFWTRNQAQPSSVGQGTMTTNNGNDPFLIDNSSITYGALNTYRAYVDYLVSYIVNGQTYYKHQDFLIQTCSATDLQSFATDDQAVDSRLDPRYSTNTFLNHQFGSTTYRGGLFAGFNNDPARVGRSLIKFAMPALPSGQSPWPVGSVSAYALRAYTPGTTTTVSCQRVSDNWMGATATWSLAPAMLSASNGQAVVDSGTGPINTWIHWPLGTDIATALLSNGGGLSVGLSSTNENSNTWAYFAKKEYNPALTPFVLYSYGGFN